MAGILVRLVLSIGCIAGVLMSHTMAVLFDRSVTLLEKRFWNTPTLRGRNVGWEYESTAGGSFIIWPSP